MFLNISICSASLFSARILIKLTFLATNMKTWVLILLIALGIPGCSNDLNEPPLTLLPGAEPSAKSRNDLGIEHYQAGRYLDALLHFNQANFADPTSGETHFNLGLAYLQEGNKEKAIKNFRKARKLAKGNLGILKSSMVDKLLQKNQE